ncbi:MAG: YigZ family protein [Neisseria sp.]|nr:YigZ family protein [Neisseria sp.]
MSEISSYQTLSAANQAEFKDKGSRFIAFAYPIASVNDVKPLVDALRQEHHKARHWCYAYRLGVDGTQFRANDDGEPAGSAGRPILGQIDSAGLSDVLVVVVRYFGGTLLGVPGLIHAYKTSTAMALQTAQVRQKNVEKTLNLRCDYPHLSEAMRLLKLHEAEIVAQDLQLDCRLHVRVPLAHYQNLIDACVHTRQIDVAVPSADGMDENEMMETKA